MMIPNFVHLRMKTIAIMLKGGCAKCAEKGKNYYYEKKKLLSDIPSNLQVSHVTQKLDP